MQYFQFLDHASTHLLATLFLLYSQVVYPVQTSGYVRGNHFGLTIKPTQNLRQLKY